MLLFLLGISLTFNFILVILCIIIYRYSVKGFLNKIEKEMFKGYDDIDISKIGGSND